MLIYVNILYIYRNYYLKGPIKIKLNYSYATRTLIFYYKYYFFTEINLLFIIYKKIFFALKINLLLNKLN